jgi:hypothetical protein
MVVVQTQQWTIGKDGTDNSFRISNSASLGTSDTLTLTGANATFAGSTIISNNEFYKVKNTTGTNYKIAGLTNGNEIQIGAIDYTSSGS